MTKTNISPPRRHPCGKRVRTVDRISDARRALEDSEKAVALAQPHRQGDSSQMLENPLGRFCVAQSLPREYYDAGEQYSSLRRRWAASQGAPMPDRLGGTGRPIEAKDAEEWLKTIREWENEMLRYGSYLGRVGVVSLCFDRPEPTIKIHVQLTISALKGLAYSQGRLTRPRN